VGAVFTFSFWEEVTMRKRLFKVVPVLALATGFALAGCGSTNTSGGTSTPTATPTSAGTISGGGGSFCDQTRSLIAQVKQLSKSVVTSPGATPDVTAFKQLLTAITSAIDSLDGSAPGDIATAFHTFRTAYDQANAAAQSATTFAQVGTAFSSVNTPAVKAAGDQITLYLKNTCGINPSATP
jgi:hypothetical protein